MKINANKIKDVRGKTGLSIAQIKKAFEQAAGDEKKALEILTAQGAVIAAKKSERSTKEGIVEAYIHANKKVGVLLELLCETDFVAKNPMFGELAHDLAMHIAAMDPQDTKELLGQPFIKDQAITVGDLLNNYIAKIGENIKLGNFIRYRI